jgi:hypothetical protein
MATKISELKTIMGSGARTNKYRVIFPYFGRDFDIQVHEVTSPGAGIGVVDVYLKGREYKIAGDRGDSGSIEMSFYNDQYLIIRNFFLRYIQNIQSYETPITIDAETIGDYSKLISDITGIGLIDDIYSGVITGIDYFEQIKYNIFNISGFVSSITGSDIMPFYQTDIVIQQLDEDERAVSEMVLHNAFISNVSDIQYTDETGDISRTTLTINYSGFKVNDQKFDDRLV